MLSNSEQESNTPVVYPKGPITPQEFFTAVQVGMAGVVQCTVTPVKDGGGPTDHRWCPPGTEFAPFALSKIVGCIAAFFSLGAFNPTNTRRFGGRTVNACELLPGFCLDIDGGPYKWADATAKGKSTEGLYETAKMAWEAAKRFIHASGLVPTFVVKSGSGGLHLYYILAEPVRRDDWQGRAARLVELAIQHGLKIDAPCTTDAARIFRAPGSIHPKSGKVVQAHSLGIAPYTPEKWDKKIGFDPATVPQLPALRKRTARADSINAEVLDNQHQPYSYKQAAQFCGAMRKAAERNGRETPYPVWILAVRAAALSTEGKDYAHEISSGYGDYDYGETDKKLASFSGGPASCAAWAAAYGAGGPCDSCEFGEV